jgi:hypothetical protein
MQSSECKDDEQLLTTQWIRFIKNWCEIQTKKPWKYGNNCLK